jgi:hypothetical protein
MLLISGLVFMLISLKRDSHATRQGIWLQVALITRMLQAISSIQMVHWRA